MEESVLVITHIDEGGIESRHQFLDLCQINVAYRISLIPGFFLQGNETRIFKKSYGNLLFLHVNNKFALHWLEFD